MLLTLFLMMLVHNFFYAKTDIILKEIENDL